MSCAVTAQLICVFVFAYAKIRFSHIEAHFFSLDAGHDGDGNSCPDNTGYIMEASSGVSSDVTTNLRLWEFSTCSIDYFTAFINQLNS